jgi:RIO kinase 1
VSLSDLTYDEIDQFVGRFRLDATGELDERNVKKQVRKPKKSKQEIVVDLGASGESASAPGALHMSYHPARYEAVWLGDSLRPFYEQGLIDDVLMLVKGGKEANVYLCQGTAAANNMLLAAKVYRPRQFRNLRNDKMYREGREILNSQGATIKSRDNREMRAIGKKTEFGMELTHISWLMHEFATLLRLHQLGAATPRAVASGENAILMGYVGDRSRPAPVLHAVTMSRQEAQRHYAEVMRNIELMLAHGMIHGDLSAYNILYWQGRVTLIDFPQVTFTEANSNAYKILGRDIQRVCDYFAQYGIHSDPVGLAERLWKQHVRLPPGGTVMLMAEE